LLLAILVAKLVATSISIGGGFPGGVFAPSLFPGAALGSAYGIVARNAFPGLDIAPQAFAMVGMAAVLAGAVHAPLTAIILLFEMTNDYRIILPLMFAVVLSLVISQRLQHDSVYTLAMARKGVRLEHGRDVEVLEAITVGEVMDTQKPTLCETDSLASATDLLAQSRHHGVVVTDAAGNLVGILIVQDIDRAQTATDPPLQTVGEACTRDLLVAYPGESIGTALRRMRAPDIGRLPVVDPENPRRLLGILRRTDMVRAYDVALTRRAAAMHRDQRIRLGAFSPVAVEEMLIISGAPCADQRLSQVQWPHESVIATVRRGRQVIIPHGDTVLKAGDVLVVVAEGKARDAVRRLCQAGVTAV
jgi:chloride channel protein, CIC family